MERVSRTFCTPSLRSRADRTGCPSTVILMSVRADLAWLETIQRTYVKLSLKCEQSIVNVCRSALRHTLPPRADWVSYRGRRIRPRAHLLGRVRVAGRGGRGRGWRQPTKAFIILSHPGIYVSGIVRQLIAARGGAGRGPRAARGDVGAVVDQE